LTEGKISERMCASVVFLEDEQPEMARKIGAGVHLSRYPESEAIIFDFGCRLWLKRF